MSGMDSDAVAPCVFQICPQCALLNWLLRDGIREVLYDEYKKDPGISPCGTNRGYLILFDQQQKNRINSNNKHSYSLLHAMLFLPQTSKISYRKVTVCTKCFLTGFLN